MYSTEKIYNMLDIDGELPHTYIICNNRSAGKTTCLLKEACENYINNKEKSMLIYRYNYELPSANTIFTDVLNIFDNLGKEITIKAHAKGLFYELFLDGNSFCFACSLSNNDQLKKYSPFFSEVTLLIFDEFQLENPRKYLTNEVQLLLSLLMTVARGGGKQSRDNLKLVLLGNSVTLFNPYFIYFGIHKRYQKDTNFLRGKGWVAEFSVDKQASQAIRDNKFLKAFNGNDYMNYATNKDMLKDNDIFCQKIQGKSNYLFTICTNSGNFGVKEILKTHILYITKSADLQYPIKYAINTDTHIEDTMLLTKNSYPFYLLKECFEKGILRFENQQCKYIIYDILAL